MKTTLQIKLLPSDEQAQALRETMRVFNHACNYVAGVAFEHQLSSKFGLQKLVYREVRDHFGLSAQMAIRVIAKTAEVYKRDKSKQCEFRPDGAIVYDQRIMSFKGIDNVSLLTMSGRQIIPMQMGDYQKSRWERGKGQADLMLRKGTFYLLVTIETPEAPTIDAGNFIGVDLGIVEIASDSDGEQFSGKEVEQVRQRNHNHRKVLQKRGTKSAKRRLKKISKRESNFRRTENHRIAKTLVQKAKGTGRGIALEYLKHIRSRTTVRKADRAKHSGWAFFQLQQFIQYKAQIAGIPVVFVNSRYTSRSCSVCGHIEKANRKSQAEFACKSCKHSQNADLNAAANIAQRAIAAAAA